MRQSTGPCVAKILFSTRSQRHCLDSLPRAVRANEADRKIDTRPAPRAAKKILHVLRRVHIVVSDPKNNQAAFDAGLIRRTVRFDPANQDAASRLITKRI